MKPNFKVEKTDFETVIKALLHTPPMPMADIPRKRKPKGKPAPRKRG